MTVKRLLIGLWIAIILGAGICLLPVLAAPSMITVTIENQSLAYGQSPSPSGYTVEYPDHINPNWYSVHVELGVDYAEGEIVAERVTISDMDGFDVTAQYPYQVNPGRLFIQQTPLRSASELLAEPIHYGQTLAESKIVGRMGYTSGGVFHEVEGSWSWKQPSARPEVSGDSWEASYTITDATLRPYFSSGSAQISVAVEPVEPCIEILMPEKIVGGQTVMVQTKNPYDEALAAPQASLSLRIGNGSVMAVSGNSLMIPADLPAGTEITLTARTEAVSGKYCATAKERFFCIEQLDFSAAEIVLESTELMYNGTPREPRVSVSIGGKPLEVNVDYTVSYRDNQHVGQAYAIVTGIGAYRGSAAVPFTITRSALTVTVQNQALSYGGRPDQTLFSLSFADGIDASRFQVSCDLRADYETKKIVAAKVVITEAQIDVTERFDIVCVEGTLDVVQSEPIWEMPPTADAILYGERLEQSAISGEMGYRDENGNFVPLCGEWSWDDLTCSPDTSESHWAEFTVTDPLLAAYFKPRRVQIYLPLLASAPSILLSLPQTVLSGETFTASVVTANSINAEKPAPEYVIRYQIGDDAWRTAAGNQITIPHGTPNGTVVTVLAGTVERAGYYTCVSDSGVLTVKQISIAEAEVTIEQESFRYTGDPITPSVTVRLGTTPLIENSDYAVRYAENVNVGRAVAVITGMGRYCGEREVEFSILQAMPEYTLPYDLAATVGQTLASIALPSGWSWTQPLTVLTEIGQLTYPAVYTPQNQNYAAVTVSLTVRVRAKALDISLDRSAFVYCGAEQVPTLTVRSGDLLLSAGKDYLVDWPSDCVNVGTKQIVISGLGEYCGTAYAEYQITRAEAGMTDFSVCSEEMVPVYSGEVKGVEVVPNPVYGGYGEITVSFRQGERSAEPIHAGEYTVYITMTQGENFAAITLPMAIGTLTIAPRALTVTALSAEKACGEADPPLFYQTAGLVGGDVLFGSLLREGGEAVGSYPILLGTLANPDYAITFVGASLTIRLADAPDAPTVSGQAVWDGDGYCYSILPIAGGEYRMDDGPWQDEPVFGGIAAGSCHLFSARIAETDEAEAGKIGVLQVSFAHVNGSAEVTLNGWVYGQAPNLPVPRSATNGTADVTYRYKPADAEDSAYCDVVPTEAGHYILQAVFAEHGQYAETVAETAFEIYPASVTVRSVTAIDRVYRACDFSVEIAAVQLEGILSADLAMAAADCGGLMGTLPDDRAGVYTEVYLSALTLIGEKKHNYSLVLPNGAVSTAVRIHKAAAPAAPVLFGAPTRHDSRFTYIIASVEGAEYRIDQEPWQDSPIFTDLVPGSTHIFSVRIKETVNTLAGEAAIQSVTFDRLPGQGAVQIADWEYGEAPSKPVPISSTNDIGQVLYQYKPYGMADSQYSDVVPTLPGRYTVRAYFAETTGYDAVFATADFQIAKAVIREAVLDIAAPVVGETPQREAMSGDGWYGTVSWLPADEKFAYGTVYAASVVLFADEWHCFGEQFSAEGFQVESREADKLMLMQYFPATSKASGSVGDDRPITMPYHQASYDVSEFFDFHANAEYAVYTLVGGSGEGYLRGSMLEVTRVGSFILSVYLPAIGEYAAFSDEVTLQIVRGVSDASIVGMPSAAEKIYVGDTFSLAVDGADGRRVSWAVHGPAVLEHGRIEIIGEGDILVTAVLAEDALYAEQTLSLRVSAARKQMTQQIPIAVILVSSSDGGRISHEGKNLVVWGSSHTFTVTPDAGHVVQDVRVNGVSIGAVDRVTVRARERICRVEVTFSP